MKICGITALVLLVVGFIMAFVAGGIKGNSIIRDVVNEVTDGRVDVVWDYDDWGVSLAENVNDFANDLSEGVSELGEEFSNIGDDIHYELDNSMVFNRNYQIDSGDVEKDFTGNNGIRNLDIEVGGCELIMKESSDAYFHVKAERSKKFQSFVENDTLYIIGTGSWDNSKPWKATTRHCEITLYVPEDYDFEAINMELGAGSMKLGKLFAENMNLEVAAGEIDAKALVGTNLNLTAGMGQIVVDEFQAEFFNADVDMGAMSAEGSVEDTVNVECGMGSIELKIDGKETEFNYDIECGMGSLKMGRHDYSGMAREKRIDNGAAKNIVAECGMGEIKIDFED